ncbi:MAG: hypothetical protein J4F49_03640 [Rhodobacteraceae bacterium]|nr:hypothetical protein [Paracoccaceae bacterium]
MFKFPFMLRFDEFSRAREALRLAFKPVFSELQRDKGPADMTSIDGTEFFRSRSIAPTAACTTSGAGR